MSKIVFGGYSPKPSPEYLERVTAERNLFIRHHGLLLAQRERIEQTPEMFYCQPLGCFLSIAYCGGGSIVLGVLLRVWNDGGFRRPCPKCGKEAWLLGLGGSPLSGNNSWWGFCPTCQDRCSGCFEPGKFNPAWSSVQKLINRYPNRAVIQRGERARFTWSGICGKNEPDIILKDKIHGLPLGQVIEILLKDCCDIVDIRG